MSDQVLRMEARSSPIDSTSHLVQHILGEIRPRNAVPRPGLPAVDVLVNDVDAARAAMDAELARPRRGAHPCPAVDFIFAGPPPHDGPCAWKVEVVETWASTTLAWVRRYCPDAVIAAAAVHWDERSPHMHLLLAPIVREGEKVRLGIKAIRKSLASGVPAPKRKRGQHRDELSAVQDSFQKHVGARFGLRRGNTQSTARHVAVDALEGTQRRLNDLKGSVEHYGGAMDDVLEQHRDLNSTVAELRHEQARLRGSREVDEREAHLARQRREAAEKEAREAEKKRKREEGFSKRVVVGRHAREGKARRKELEQKAEELEQERDTLSVAVGEFRTRVNGLEARAANVEAHKHTADAAMAAANETVQERERLRTRNAELEGRVEAIDQGEQKLREADVAATERRAALDAREQTVATELRERTEELGRLTDRVASSCAALTDLETQASAATHRRNEARAAAQAAKRQRQEDHELGGRRTRRGRELRRKLAELEAENATLQTQVQGDDVQQHRALLEKLAAGVQENLLREQARLAEEEAEADREQARKDEALEERREAQQERDEARKAQQEAEAATEEARRDSALGSRRTQEGRALRKELEDAERALEKEREGGQRLTSVYTSLQQRLDPMRARAESAENRLESESQRANRAAHNARGAVFQAIETHVGPEYAQRVREAMNNETTEVRSVGQGPRRR